MRTAILVLSVDEADRLRDSLPAAAAQGADEVVVVDDACFDETAEVAREHGARVVPLASRVSYAAAMNSGLREVRGCDAVMLLNADCVLDPGALSRMVAALEREPSVAAVAPLLVRADDPARVDAAGIVVDRRRKNLPVGHGEPAAAWSTPGEVFAADAACALYRRAALDDVALGDEVLDEDLALWTVESDLGWRLRLAGWRAVYEPAATGRHVRFYSPSNRANVAAEHRRLQFRNRLLMVAKNERAADLLRDLPRLASYEALALGHALLRERELLGAYRDAWRALPAARRRRRAFAARRAAGARAARPPFGLTPPRTPSP